MLNEHTSREYERELRDVRDRLLEMGGRVESQIARAVRAMVERDGKLAEQIMADDQRIDDEEVNVDEHCLRVLARRQPMASDLRFIAAAFKIVTDLERVGDLAVNICKRALDLNTRPPLAPPVDIPRLATLVQGQLAQALEAFVKSDAVLARQVLDQDGQVDQLNAELIRQIIDSIVEQPSQVPQGIAQISISRYLERVGDHATNVAEMVIFLVQGRDVRHHHSE